MRTASKHVHAPPCRNVVPTESHSDGQNTGYFLTTLRTVLLALGYSEPPSTRSSRLRVAPVAIPVVLCSLPLFRSAKSRHCLRDTIYAIIILHSSHLVIGEPFWPYVWNN